jgi:uncharacterized repeat protein (TIGR02543 family)
MKKRLTVLLAAAAVMTWTWTAAGFTITLDRNYTGATANTTRETDSYGCLMGEPLPVPVRTGQVFNGWFTTAATGGSRVLVGATGTKFTQDSTIYARWSPAASVSMNNIPAAMRENFEWLKNTRHVREPVLFGRQNLIFDQIWRGEGSINWAVRWESDRVVTLAERQAVARMLHEEINKWTRPLIGMPDWPYQEIPVTVIGWAVGSASYIQDKQPNETVWVNNDKNQPAGTNHEAFFASAPNDISRFVNFSNVNAGRYTYPGGLHARFDMYLWATKGFGGGAGGDWGSRLSETGVINIANGGNSTILTHEIGHGFGLYDFYGIVGEDRPPTTSTGGVFGQGDLRTVMIAGGGAPTNPLNAYDQWQIRYYWDWVKNGSAASRFPTPTTSVIPPTAAARTHQPSQFKFDSRGTLNYNLGGAQTANLKIFNSRGRLLKTMQLSGTQTTVNTNLNVAPQMLIWKVETMGKVMEQGKMQFMSR